MKIFDFLSPSCDEIEKIEEQLLPNSLSGLNILDLASGTGEHLRKYFDKGIAKVTVIDQNRESLEKLKNRYSDTNEKIELIEDDIFRHDFQEKYSVVTILDNSLQIFQSYGEQYQIIKLIASTLKKDGTGIINITPIAEDDILNFSGEYKHLEEQQNMDSKMLVNIKVDMFEQKIFYRYKQNDDKKQITARFILEKELTDMVLAAGLFIAQEKSIVCKNGKVTKFYFLKLK